LQLADSHGGICRSGSSQKPGCLDWSTAPLARKILKHEL
jgi:hypothetical protein